MDRTAKTWRAHSTPDPETPPPDPRQDPDDVPAPERAPVREPDAPEPPVKAVFR